MKKICFVFCLSVFLSATTWASKPLPPVEIVITEEILPDETSRLTLLATSHRDTDRVQLSLELPSDMPVLDGQSEWEGPMKTGEKKQIDLVVNRHGLTRKIMGKAILYMTERDRFIQKSILILGNENTFPASRLRPKGGTTHPFRSKP